MSEKNNDRFTICVIAGIILLFALADFVAKFGLTGDYDSPEEKIYFRQVRYEKLIFDTRVFLGKREVDDVYIGKKGKVFEMHSAEQYSEKMILTSIGAAGKLFTAFDAMFMLVPTADEIWKEDLPKYIDTLDQAAYLDLLSELIGTEAVIDIRSTFQEHSDEQLYFHTDPHWTTMAAYYAYQTWRDKTGSIPYYYDPGNQMLLTKQFKGRYTEHKYLNLKQDALYVFRETLKKPVMVLLDESVEKSGFYRPEYVNRGNPYYYFLGDDFETARIDTGRDREKKLLVIGDSYANCMIPLLAPHYKEILFLNTEHFQGDIFEAADAYTDEDTEVLILQSVPWFIEYFGKEAAQ